MHWYIHCTRTRRQNARIGLFGLAVLLFLSLATTTQAQSAPMLVTTFSDVIDGSDGYCSLREAVVAANTNRPIGTAAGECAPQRRGADTIELPAGLYKLERTSPLPEAFALSGDLDIYGDLTISSQGNGLTVIQGTFSDDRVLEIVRGKVTINGLTITGGNSILSGGGIYNFGTLTLENSTLTGNKAVWGGGALYNRGSAQLTNVTITGNEASWGSGLQRASGKLNVRNSMIVDDSCAGKIDARSGANYNLAFNASGCSASAFGISTDPGLVPEFISGLAGTAVLFAIPTDSPAADTADAGLCPPVDQRGMTRPQGAGCDIGAFEVEQAVAPVAPEALADNYTTGEDTLLSVPAPGLLENDSANGNAPLTVLLSGPTPAGALTLNGDGSFEYTPPRHFVGTDTFRYTASGNGQTSAPALVSIEVTENGRIEVTNTCDSGAGSLRAALAAANSRPGPDTIIFDISDESCGPQTIELLSALPALSGPVVIDGLARPAGQDRAAPFITLTGQGGTFSGFDIPAAAAGSTIRGLIIVEFGGSGIVIGRDGPSSGNVIDRNTINDNGYGNDQTSSGVALNDGITVIAGLGNEFIGNSINNNSDLPIDLGGDGYTPNDPGDPDTGANNLQNFPLLLTAPPSGAIGGLLNSSPNQNFTLQFFSSVECSTESLTPLVASPDTFQTDSAGNVFFAANVGPLTQGLGIFSVAADQQGNTSELSNCVRVSDDNDVWPRARLINSGTELNQFLDLSGQSRWYKFAANANSQIVAKLFNLPANYDIAIYKDIAAAYAEQVSSTQTNLEIIGAETAPAVFNPATFNPATFNPATFNPATFNPAVFNPAVFNPATFNAAQNSGELVAPAIFNPAVFNPAVFNPAVFNPAVFNPAVFNGNAYSVSQTSSMIAVSAYDGQAPEELNVNSWNNAGIFYLRVTGRQAAFDPNAPFSLSLDIENGNCGVLDATPGTGSPTGQAANLETLILVDWARMGDKYGAQAGPGSPLANKLASLATAVNGVVIDVNDQGRVAAANAQADNNELCPYAKNIVADSVKEVIDAYWDANPNLKYLVIVGSDNDIPFFRLPDTTPLGQEENYDVPVAPFTSSQASLRNNYFLSQDGYAARLGISFENDAIPVPELAIGRLAETPDDIMTVIDAFLDPGGQVVEPQNAVVTAYDFLADGGQAVNAVLAAATGLNINDDLLVSNPDVWTAAELEGVLNTNYAGRGFDLAFLSGHFSANAALAADYATYYLTTDLLDSPVELTNAIVFSPGCHSSYNIVNEHNLPETFEPDWPQAFSQKGVTLIGGTGYQYGDTDFVEYSERLYLEFARQLRSNKSSEIAVGDALAKAKLQYLIDTPDWRPIHHKALLQTTLFGLPMLKVNMPGPRLNLTPATGGINPGDLQDASLIPDDPADQLGLRTYDLSRNYLAAPLQMTEVFKTLTNQETNAAVNVSYLELGPNGRKSLNAGEPVLPLDTVDVSVSGTTLRGVGFLGGDFRDFFGRQPLPSAATTELSAVRINFLSNALFPVTPFSVNRFDVLTRDGGTTRLNITPAQYKSESGALESATLRRFDNMQVRLFYSDFSGTFNTGSSVNEPGLAGAPTINFVNAELDSTAVTFLAQVTGDPSAGIHQVWVTYHNEVNAGAGGAAGSWQSLFLTQDAADSRLWRGTLANVSNPGKLRFMAQAVSGTGLVTMNVNLGRFFIVSGLNNDPDPTQLADLQVVDGTPSGNAKDIERFRVTLLGPGSTAVADQTVFFGLGSNQVAARTNSSGVATVDFPLLVAPGTYDLTAWFQGTADYLPSTAEDAVPFTITKQPTTLALDPAASVINEGQAPPFIATLRDDNGDPLPEQTVRFVLTPNGGGSEIRKAVITNPNGAAPLGALALPPGTYTVQAAFNGTSALGISSSAVRNLTVNEVVIQPQVVRLLDSAGNGLAGATAKYYNGGWISIPGSTDANGNLPYTISAGTYVFQITYEGGLLQKQQNIGAEPTVLFQTVNVVVELLDSNGAALVGGAAQYYAGSWRQFPAAGADGRSSKELLPREYTFAMKYEGAQLNQVKTVSTQDALVTFQTVNVVVELLDSSGLPLVGGAAEFYASSWRQFPPSDGDGRTSKELLPKEYSFAMTYAGGRTQIVQYVNEETSLVTFRTTLVTVRLQTAGGTPLSGGAAEYYATAWFSIGTTDESGEKSIELLPAQYSFAMTYAGERQQQNQAVSGTSALITFTH